MKALIGILVAAIVLVFGQFILSFKREISDAVFLALLFIVLTLTLFLLKRD